MSSDVEIKVGLDIEPNADSLRKLQSEIKKSSEVTLNHAIQGSGSATMPGKFDSQFQAVGTKLLAIAGTLTGVVGGISGGVFALKKLGDQIAVLRDQYFGLTENAQRALHVEEVRTKMLSAQLAFMQKQMDIQLELNDKIFKAESLAEKWEQEHGEAVALREERRGLDLEDIAKELQKQNAINKQGLNDMRVTGSKDSASWYITEHGVANLIDIKKSFVNNAHGNPNANIQIEHTINDKFKVLETRATEYFGSMMSRIGQFSYKDHEDMLQIVKFQNEQQRDVAIGIIDNYLSETDKQRSAEKANAVKNLAQLDLQSLEKDKKDFVATMEDKREKDRALNEYLQKQKTIISDLSRLQTTMDAHVYALRKKQIDEEYMSELAYIKEVSAEREKAAQNNRDVDYGTMMEIQKRRDARNHHASVNFDVSSSINRVLTPNSLSGMYGEQEDVARIEWYKEEQAALERYNNDIKRIDALDLKEEKKEEKRRVAEDTMNATRFSNATKYAMQLKQITSHAESYSTVMEGINAHAGKGVAMQAEIEQHTKNTLAIMERFQKAYAAARSEAERQTVEQKKQTELAQEKERHEIAARQRAAQDRLAEQLQSNRRNSAETAITGASNVAAEMTAAISEFRTKVYEGMVSGSMNAFEYEIASMESVYRQRMSRERALHDQRMQYLQDEESAQEKVIDMVYQNAIAKIQEDLRTGAINNDIALERTTDAENEKQGALQVLRMNPRGSIREEARFKEQMARAQSHHNESLARLKAIDANTGKLVSSMSIGYKDMSERFYGRTNLAMFGVGGGYEMQRGGSRQPMGVLADREMINNLNMLTKLAGQAVSALRQGSVARYG